MGRVGRALAALVAGAALIGCGVQDSTVSSGADAARSIVPVSTTPPTLPPDLPDEGIAIATTGGGVRLYALDGTELASYPDAVVDGPDWYEDRFVVDGSPMAHLVIRTAQAPLIVGRRVPWNVRPLDQSGPARCETAARGTNVTVLLCGHLYNELVVAERIEVVGGGGRRRVLMGSPPAGGGDASSGGTWYGATLSPDGNAVLAHWSGECEVPHAFVVSLDGGAPKLFEGTDVFTAPDSMPMGWTADGEALALMETSGCGTDAPVAGVYAMGPGEDARLVAKLPPMARANDEPPGVFRWTTR